MKKTSRPESVLPRAIALGAQCLAGFLAFFVSWLGLFMAGMLGFPKSRSEWIQMLIFSGNSDG